MKQRRANFELLRIVAMLMIITMHYLDKGGILPKPDAAFGTVGYLAWGMEAFCVCAVNVYVLISAYFLAECEYRPLKAVKLWLTVVFYSVTIAAVLAAVGVIPLSQLDPYRILNYIFPVIEEHYWFVTAYILMFLLAPLMNGTLRSLPVRTYRQGIFLLLLLLCVSKSILPVKLPTDRLGYDALWFLCLYLIGAYIRYHGKERYNGWFAAAGYFLCCLLMFASFAALRSFYQKTGSLADFINRQYQYNSVLCLLAAICLFLAFAGFSIPEGKTAALICKAASASFGVYLIHEHLDVRYLWPQWIGTAYFADTFWFLLHWLLSIVAVYVVCMVIDFVRQWLFIKIKIRT